MGPNGDSAVKCAVFYREVRLHRWGVSGTGTMKSDFRATKTVVAVMKSLLMAERRQFPFEIFGAVETFVGYKRFSGSLAFPYCQDFSFFDNKRIRLSNLLPCMFYHLFINPVRKEKNVRPKPSGISLQIEKYPDRGIL